MHFETERSVAAQEFSEIMTVHDLAVYLKLSDAKIYRMARDGDLPVVRIGKSWRFTKGTIDEWLRELVRTNGKGGL